MATGKKQLYRATDDRIVGGVCGGLGAYFNVDANLVRLVWAVATVLSGGIGGIVVYVLAMVLMPEGPGDESATAASTPMEESLDVRAWAEEHDQDASKE